MTEFDKDAWIRRALKQRVYYCKPDGSVWKRKGIKDGKPVYKRVRPSVHKPSGRVYFNMTFEGVTKSVLVNRIVAWQYHPNPENKPQVNHKDGNKENNAEDNLEWATASENEEHAFRTGLKSTRGSANANAKLNVGEVIEIRNSDEQDRKVLAIKYSVSEKTIRDIQENKTWTHI
jgi:hypothetical protein